MRVRRSFACLVGVFLLVNAHALAAIDGSVRGVVHDPQHRPVPGALVTLKAQRSAWQQTATTDAQGAFQIPAVPVGEYTVAVELQGFQAAAQLITVISGTAPELHFQLQLAPLNETVTVSASAEGAHPDSVTPTTLVSRHDITQTPGADRTNGLEAITAFVPGSYVTHDQLHVRGGHQVTWLIDGVPVPNSNIGGNVGPQVDPKDIDYLEVQRGSYAAEYGDRTYAMFNVVPRTGFERDNDGELVLSAGNFFQTNDQISLGGHTQRFAYFVSANVNRSDLGLGTPVADVIHDRQTGGGGFASLVFNANPANQWRAVTSVRHDSYQIPNTATDQTAGIDDAQRESDAFANVSWARTFNSRVMLTVSPFLHYNAANFDGGVNDPISTTDHRASRYVGAQGLLSADVSRNQLRVGFYGFRQSDDQLFGLLFNDAGDPGFSVRQRPSGNLIALFAQDTLRLTSWMTVSGGIRQTHFAGGVTEDATSPRVGMSLQIPSVGATVRGFYGRFYQGPPLETAAGPLLDFVTAQDLAFIPLHGERDEEYQVGVNVPVRGWALDADRFQTRATNYFDHNPIGNSSIFFPVTIDGALIRGWEVTLRSPKTWQRGQVHLAYSNQSAQGLGSISGGLTDFSTGGGYFPLDHDQRHTLSVGFDAELPRRVSVAADLYYGSGFVDEGGPAHLPGHASVNISVEKPVTSKLSLSAVILNATNNHLLIDNSLTFGGTHFNNPREVYGQVRYRFHY